MSKSKIKLVHLLLALAFTGTVFTAQAQGPADPNDDPDPSPAIPFDGGISLVVAAGIAYAAKKGYDKRRKQSDNNLSEK